MQTQMHETTVVKLRVLVCSVGHVARSGNSSGEGFPAPGDYRTGIPEGECLGFCMLEGWSGGMGSVFLSVTFF